MSDTEGPEPVGSLAEEAAKLFGVLAGWAREHGDGVSGMAGAMTGSVTGGLHEHLATGSPECAWCPVCRVVAAIRRTDPEVRAHLASAASSLMLAVSGMLDTHPDGRSVGVEKIDLDDDPDDDLDDWREDEP